MAHYLVTGGCGFIGGHLVDRLRGAGDTVTVLDDLSTGHAGRLDPSVRLIIGDVSDKARMAEASAGIDGCFHLAAIASVQRSLSDWLGTHRANQTGTITVFDALKTRGCPVVYASSAAVYGDDPGRAGETPIAETSRLLPLTGYGADKLGSELHAQVGWTCHGVPSTGLRFFNVYGPGQDPHSPYSGVISIFLDRMAGGLPINIHGDGGQQRDFIFVDDVVDHLLAAMQHTRKGAAVYNVCTGRGTSIVDLAGLIGQNLGAVPDLVFGPARPGDIRVSIGSPDLASQALGLRAATAIEAGLAQLIAAQRAAEAA